MFSGLGNTRHFDLLLGAQFKWKLWSWESLFPGSWRQSWRQWWWMRERMMRRTWWDVESSGWGGTSHPTLASHSACLCSGMSCDPHQRGSRAPLRKGRLLPGPLEPNPLQPSHRAAFASAYPCCLVLTPPGWSQDMMMWLRSLHLGSSLRSSEMQNSGTSGVTRGSMERYWSKASKIMALDYVPICHQWHWIIKLNEKLTPYILLHNQMVNVRQIVQNKALGNAFSPAWAQASGCRPFLTLVSDLGSYWKGSSGVWPNLRFSHLEPLV